MNKTLTIFAALLAVAAAGCQKKAEEPAVPEAPEQAVVQDAATQVGVSTSSQIGVMLNAPGNYVKGMVGNVEKAKKAAAQYNKIAENRMNMDPETGK
ncbi:MAG: hypothetical protein COT18_02865 [Elusimicrobia bacterium CG08_land_8_20_14_0_20_59_10]|nr:MAG: hypothetical protein COT18_02865 [Elusimicrobia bacterium CG08_land_8_20_14_0_20_59_10]